jgi:hypothetical protein
MSISTGILKKGGQSSALSAQIITSHKTHKRVRHGEWATERAPRHMEREE